MLSRRNDDLVDSMIAERILNKLILAKDETELVKLTELSKHSLSDENLKYLVKRVDDEPILTRKRSKIIKEQLLSINSE